MCELESKRTELEQRTKKLSVQKALLKKEQQRKAEQSVQ